MFPWFHYSCWIAVLSLQSEVKIANPCPNLNLNLRSRFYSLEIHSSIPIHLGTFRFCDTKSSSSTCSIPPSVLFCNKLYWKRSISKLGCLIFSLSCYSMFPPFHYSCWIAVLSLQSEVKMANPYPNLNLNLQTKFYSLEIHSSIPIHLGTFRFCDTKSSSSTRSIPPSFLFCNKLYWKRLELEKL